MLGSLTLLTLLFASPQEGAAQIMTSEELTQALWQPMELSTFHTASPALAYPSVELRIPQEEGPDRFIWTFLWSAGGAAVGAVAYGRAYPRDDDGYAQVLGYLAGSTLGAAIGGSLFSDDRSFPGALLRSVGGGVVGLLASAVIAPELAVALPLFQTAAVTW